MFTDINFFSGKGHILNTKDCYNFRIMGYKNCLIGKSHFIDFPLMTYKSVFCNSWSEVGNLMPPLADYPEFSAGGYLSSFFFNKKEEPSGAHLFFLPGFLSSSRKKTLFT
jgi:hypothetical protein